MTVGVAYYNSGRGCLLRLAVSLHSLRRHYAGPVTILHEQDDGDEYCHRIAVAFGADCLPTNFDPPIPDGPHYPFVAKTRVPGIAPYDVTAMLDADTLVRAPIEDIFAYIAGPIEFAVPQFANWNTSGKIAKRILGVAPHFTPLDIAAALAFGRAINNGVVVFRKQTTFARVWYAHALASRAGYIPDEATLQVLVANYRDVSEVIPHWWNVSCKYDDPLSPECKIVHHHGRKSYRFDQGKPIYHSEMFYEEWEQFKARHGQLADALYPTDRHVRQHAAEYAKWRAGK